MTQFSNSIRTFKASLAPCLILITVGLLLSFAQPVPAFAQSAISATQNRATIQFPLSVTFSVDAASDSTISKVVLEYGMEKLTCTDVTSTAIPTFTPGKSTSASWTWEMRLTGSEPAGTRIWWRWRIMNANGKELLTDRQTITWLDNQYQWQTIRGDRLVLHWYIADRSFGTILFDSANKSLADVEAFTGLKSDAPPDVYLYGSSQEMREAHLFSPPWVGGYAFYQYNIVVLGIALSDMTWTKSSIAHELTHVLDRRATFSCGGNRPTWLTEGLAMVGEGGLDTYYLGLYNNALSEDKFISVRSLGGNFPDDRVSLAYAQSWSLVNFLLTEYGKDKFWVLLRTLQNGATIDNALRSTYNYDTDGLEDVWRAKIGAKPRANAGQSAAATTPTAVPTAALVSGFQFPTRTLTPTPAMTEVPPTVIAAVVPVATVTAAPVNPVAPEKPAAPDGSMTIVLGAAGILAVVVGIVFVFMKRQKEMKK